MRYERIHGPYIARAASLFWWRRVFVGTWFDRLPERQQRAVLAHESFHVFRHHTEWRIVAILVALACAVGMSAGIVNNSPLWMTVGFAATLFTIWSIPNLCRHQEYGADHYTAMMGYRDELVKLLHNTPPAGGMFHPTVQERVARLLAFASPPLQVTSPVGVTNKG